MQRKDFIKSTLVTATGLIIFPSFSDAKMFRTGITLTELEKNFLSPPLNTRPWVFWMWMNGNITKEGITLDLEAMKRMGIGGVINFNSAVGIPRGPIDYAGEEWMEATAHAVREANRLGIEMTLHNSPGYSGAGGPWITPEMSMQQLVWTETLVSASGEVNVQLAKPFAKHGYYRDAFVVAYPSLPVEKAVMKDKLIRVTANGKEIDKEAITDGSSETKIRLEKTVADNNGNTNGEYDTTVGTAATNRGANNTMAAANFLVLEFADPFEARAITITRKPEIPRDLFDGPRDHPPIIRVESSDDNINYKPIGTIRPPELREMDTPAALSFDVVKAKYFRLAFSSPSWICDVELFNGPRLGGWPGKTSYTHGDSGGDTPAIGTELLIDPSKLLDISAKMNSDGRLVWKPAAGNWTILRIGHTTTGEENAAHPDAGKGLELDKFRREALTFHFEKFLDKFLDRIKPFIGKSFKGVTVDSWEAGKQNWTIGFDKEFKERRGYELLSFLPALTGRIVGSVEETERFLWDVRKTQADLLADNFYGYYAEQCHKRNLSFSAEPYGDGNLDSLKIGQHLDIPMSEFWTRYIYGSDVTSKQAASIAHVYGKPIVAAESFTAMPATSKWTDYPYSLKAEGDYFYTLGVNRLVFHTFVHQPYTTGKPGMTMGPFGMHIDRNNTWTEQAYGWTGYLQRAQYLLQQGLAAVDIVYIKGDTPDSGVPDVYRFLPMGYAGDVVGTDALFDRFVIKDNKIVLPDGMRYRLCVMAPLQATLLSTINQLKKLVNDGMILVVSSKPAMALGKNNSDAEIKAVVDELYGEVDGKTSTERSYGKGKLIWNRNIEQVLQAQQILPDFDYKAQNADAVIHYIHKYIGGDEFYFISNHKRQKENLVCSFRTSGKQPEMWNGETGRIYNAAVYDTTDGRTQVAIELEPAGSLFVVFRNRNIGNGYTGVLKGDKQLLSTGSFNNATTGLYKDVSNDFTISVWIKPDTFAQANRSLLFHAPDGEALYGAGHTAIGISAGQNAIRVYERGGRQARELIAYNGPIEGWTHVVVMIDNGKPSLYINGKQVAKKDGSGKIIHPGLDPAPSQEQFSSYFEGNYTPPQLIKNVISAEGINTLYKKGLPPPVLPSGAEISRQNNRDKVLVWENGNYLLQMKAGTKELANITGCTVAEVTGAWTVKFPVASGAPAMISLPSLISLRTHTDVNVKYFAGTCTYSKTITIDANTMKPGKRLFLHAGRVEIIAEIRINKKKVAILWKEPFMTEITGFVKAGINDLEIDVTTLWANRLIGDEFLPVENDYSEHKFIKAFPDWYTHNQPKPGARKAFAAWKVYEKTSPLLEAGLLGPVKIITAIEKTI